MNNKKNLTDNPSDKFEKRIYFMNPLQDGKKKLNN